MVLTLFLLQCWNIILCDYESTLSKFSVGNKNKYIIDGLSWNLNLYDHESTLSKFSVENKNKYIIEGFIDWFINLFRISGIFLFE
jgi:hypothetical protein